MSIEWLNQDSFMMKIFTALDEQTLDLHKVFDDYINLYCKFIISKATDFLVIKIISELDRSTLFQHIPYYNKIRFSSQWDQCFGIFAYLHSPEIETTFTRYFHHAPTMDSFSIAHILQIGHYSRPRLLP